VVKGRNLDRLQYKEPGKKAAKADDFGFYKKQLRIVLRNCGVIDPENIDEYIARDGYVALEKALTIWKPEGWGIYFSDRLGECAGSGVHVQTGC
jgi:hypothetical protein